LANGFERDSAEKGLRLADQVRKLTIRGIVDTGAAMLVIPESVAKDHGLEKNGAANVRYADHRTANRDIVRGVDLELQGRRDTFSAIVEPGRTQTLHPRDPDRIIAEIE
jgi:hypothetical protein